MNGIDFCMLTTRGNDGKLRSGPMYTQQKALITGE